jgi:hypothetical protein
MEPRTRTAVDERTLDALVDWFALWRVASARHVHSLFGDQLLRSPRNRWGAGAPLTVRGIQSRLLTLTRMKCLVARTVVGLADARAVKVTAALGETALLRHWQEVDVASALRDTGYAVFRGPLAAIALRRAVIDGAADDGVRAHLRADPTTPRSAFARPVARRDTETLVVWVDDGRAIDLQAAELPLWTPGQGSLKVVVRPLEQASVFDVGTGAWVEVGPRLREMVQALKASPGGAPAAFGLGGHLHKR